MKSHLDSLFGRRVFAPFLSQFSVPMSGVFYLLSILQVLNLLFSVKIS